MSDDPCLFMVCLLHEGIATCVRDAESRMSFIMSVGVGMVG